MVLLCNMLCKDIFLKHDIFYHKTHIEWDVIISSSLRLLLTVWIWYRCRNRIENYYQYDWQELGFYKKVHMKRTSFLWNTTGQLLLQKDTLAQIFLCKFCQIFRKVFLQNISWQPLLAWFFFPFFRSVRFEAENQFIWWSYSKLGEGIQKPVQFCVFMEIR